MFVSEPMNIMFHTTALMFPHAPNSGLRLLTLNCFRLCITASITALHAATALHATAIHAPSGPYAGPSQGAAKSRLASPLPASSVPRQPMPPTPSPAHNATAAATDCHLMTPPRPPPLDAAAPDASSPPTCGDRHSASSTPLPPTCSHHPGIWRADQSMMRRRRKEKKVRKNGKKPYL
jgi:hypothetical protein